VEVGDGEVEVEGADSPACVCSGVLYGIHSMRGLRVQLDVDGDPLGSSWAEAVEGTHTGTTHKLHT